MYWILSSLLGADHWCYSYINNLHTYLFSFAKRTQPLVDLEKQQLDADNEFSEKWEAEEIPGWEETSVKSQANGSTEGGIWCSACKYSYANLIFVFTKTAQ